MNPTPEQRTDAEQDGHRPVLLASPMELLRWQARWRALVGVLTATTLTALQARGLFAGEPSHVLRVLLPYLAVVGLAAFAVPRRAAWTGQVASYVTIVMDVVALTAVTAAASRPGHHDWVLLVGFFVVHLAEYSFGRHAAVLAVLSTTAGYLVLFGARPDTPASEWSEAAFALVIFLAVTATFLSQYASRRRRLRRIIALFERAEHGDFTEAYDLAADRRPDAVSAVGGAYNRVRTRLERLVLTDSLTGCLNRRGFEQALARELGRVARNGGEAALLAIDIDHFKQVNDTHGHMAGDAVLRQLGPMLLALVRAGDVVARTGGDEFLVLCPDATRDGAEQLARRLCERIAGHDFTSEGIRVVLTVSVGLAMADLAHEGDTVPELLRRADRALYEAKRLGRNRVQCWTRESVGSGA